MNGSIKITDKINTVFFIETNSLFGLVTLLLFVKLETQ